MHLFVMVCIVYIDRYSFVLECTFAFSMYHMYWSVLVCIECNGIYSYVLVGYVLECVGIYCTYVLVLLYNRPLTMPITIL